MNPEEGDLRPQLLDRFGLCVEVSAILDVEARMEIVRRLLENNPYAGAEVAQKLGEAIQRGYWQATDQERQQLKEAYMEIENWIEAGNAE